MREVGAKAVHICEEDKEIFKPAHPSQDRPFPLKFRRHYKKCNNDSSQCRVLKRGPSQPDPVKTIAPPVKKAIPPWIPRASNQSSRPISSRQGEERERQSNQPSGRRVYDKKERREPSEIKVIKMILGSTDGDSNRARKAWSRMESLGVGSRNREEGPVISFGPRDLEDVMVPHNDALVIHARVAKYEVQRVFVDSGSSVNVIFKEAFDQMRIQGYKLEAIETALFGLSGHTVYPSEKLFCL